MPSSSSSSALWKAAFAKLDARKLKKTDEPSSLEEAIDTALFLAGEVERKSLGAVFAIWGDRMRPGAGLAILEEQERERARPAGDGGGALEAIGELWAQAARSGWVDEALAREHQNRLGQALGPYLWSAAAMFEPALAASVFQSEAMARDLYGPQIFKAWLGALTSALESPGAATLASGVEIASALGALGALAPHIPGALPEALKAFAAGPATWKSPRWEGEALEEERLAREQSARVFETLASMRNQWTAESPPVCALIALSIVKGLGELADGGQAEISERCLSVALEAGFDPRAQAPRVGSALKIIACARPSYLASQEQKDAFAKTVERCAQRLLKAGSNASDLREGSVKKDMEAVHFPHIKSMIQASLERSALIEQALGLSDVETEDLRRALDLVKAQRASESAPPSAPSAQKIIRARL